MKEYIYKGMSLHNYCEDNYINYQSMIHRIRKLQNLNVGLSDDEAVRLAVENYVNGNTKYKFQNMSLRTYCENSNIDYSRILRRIYKFQKSYPELTIDEIIELALDENFDKSERTKYMYQGLSLIDYCQKNDLNYATIYKRIKKLESLNVELSTEEAVRLALEKRFNGNTKYIYQGMSLNEYCQKNYITPSTLVQKINKIKKRNEGISDDEAVRLAIENDINGNSKYIYNGISLSNYCIKYNIKYSTLLHKVHQLQKENPNISDEEATKQVVNNFFTKYTYKEGLLVEYCNNNRINYLSVLHKISILQQENPNLTIDEIIELALINNKGCSKYQYNGFTLANYCKNNGLNYDAILSKIRTIKKRNETISNEEAVRLAIENNINGNTKYIYNGIALSEYCRQKGLNYNLIQNNVCRLKKLNVGLSYEEAIKIVIENHIRTNNCYKYQGLSLTKYCQENSLNYSTVLGRIYKYKKTNPDISDNEAIMLAVEDDISDDIKNKYPNLVLIKKYKKSK